MLSSHMWQVATLLDSAGLSKLSNSYTQTRWPDGFIKYYCWADTHRKDLRVQPRWLVEPRPSPRRSLFLSSFAVNRLLCSVKIRQSPSHGETLCLIMPMRFGGWNCHSGAGWLGANILKLPNRERPRLQELGRGSIQDVGGTPVSADLVRSWNVTPGFLEECPLDGSDFLGESKFHIVQPVFLPSAPIP